jgi:S1-C subfamily serine protease
MPTTPDLTPLTTLSASVSSLVAATAPSIVSVHSHRALSSGFVWKPGLIVTADEALADEGEVAVTRSGGRRVPATVAGRDPTTDVALIRAETGDAPPIALDGAVPSAGSLALALGARDGGAVAALGVVSSSAAAWTSMRGGEIDARIELDLSLRRHAEGGITIDHAGRAFGMPVFGPRRRVLVIPSATVARVANALEAHGKMGRGYLGLRLQSVRLDRDEGIGAMAMSVESDGPGAKAGIQQGDVLVAFDGRPIGSVNALLRALGPASIGKSVSVSVRRGGETRALLLEIGERP